MSIGPLYPFPPDVHVSRSSAKACCELPLATDEGSQFLVIYARSYMGERDAELIEKGQFTKEELYPELEHMETQPNENCRWLYCLQSFKVNREDLESQEKLFANSYDYGKAWFSDFSNLLSYCGTKYSVSPSDFKNEWETSYPRW